MKKSVLLFLIAWGGSMIAFPQQRPKRIPAAPYPHAYVQPDGDTLNIRLRGDENYHFHTTLDDYKIIKDKKGYFRYAKERNGKLVPSCRKAHNQENRTKAEQNYLNKNGIK